MKRIASPTVCLALALIALPAAACRAQDIPGPQQPWSADQLDDLVAPIALYPDPLLSQILVASTYPLEVVQASQWLQRNRNLRGQELVDAARRQPWDPSVQALVTVPDALDKLNQDIEWTTDLGDAFLAQQADVMNAVQRMRRRAEDNGRLTSTPQQTVTDESEPGGGQDIVIQPASPEVIYVPVYDPDYIWGAPLYGYYPPLPYPGFGFGFGIGFDLGFCFGGWGGWGGWGWNPSWHRGAIVLNHGFLDRYGFRQSFRGGYGDRPVWVHDPDHRLRVPYGDSRRWARQGAERQALQNSIPASGALSRMSPPGDYRGEPQQAGHGSYRAPQSFAYRQAPAQQAGRESYRAPQSFAYRQAPAPRFQSAPRQAARESYRAPQSFAYRQAPAPRFQSAPRQAGRESYRAPQSFAHRQAPAPRFQSAGRHGFGRASAPSSNRGGGHSHRR